MKGAVAVPAAVRGPYLLTAVRDGGPGYDESLLVDLSDLHAGKQPTGSTFRVPPRPVPLRRRRDLPVVRDSMEVPLPVLTLKHVDAAHHDTVILPAFCTGISDPTPVTFTHTS